MAQSKLYPVVMAGGSGSRLWPLSRVLYPKQFLCLKGDLTMLQTTICRLNGVECESGGDLQRAAPLYCRGTAASTK